MDSTPRVTGTLMWYYYVCHRQVWLMARNIEPDADDDNLSYGRFLHEHAYRRERKEISIGHAKFDIVSNDGRRLVVSEVKKSSKHLLSARRQLMFYLRELKRIGVDATGEIRIPDEKKRLKVELTPEDEAEIDRAERDILKIMYKQQPPAAKKIPLCRNCAYREFCWS